jgi:hypothetical protein
MIYLLNIISLCLLFSCENKPLPPKPPAPVGENPIKTFHLNYKPDKNWSKCSTSDYVVFDMFDTSKEDFDRCKAMGAKMLCYFSSQYEEWRPDAKHFGKLGSKLDGWEGERWISPDDPKNLTVMKYRLGMAKWKCDGIDLDNIDREGHEQYILEIFKEAKKLGLLVSQKNALEKIEFFRPYVDLYQNEQCQEYNECDFYRAVGKPVFNIEYKSCRSFPFMYSVQKDMQKMDSWEIKCE